MTDHAAMYDVQKRTGTSEHASVNTICEHMLERVADPRTDHLGALDGTMATVIDRYGGAVVRAVIHRILVDDVSFRTAAAEHDVGALDEVPIRTVATQVLSELDMELQT